MLQIENENMGEVKRAFNYHYSRCGLTPDIAEKHWGLAMSDNPERIVTYEERETGVLRAYYLGTVVRGQSYADGSPLIAE